MNDQILIVEDEQLVAADLESKLHRLGYSVVGCAASGQDALRMAADYRPDLVLMDIRLQGEMDGMEVARRLEGLIDTRVIFVSAFAQLSRLKSGDASREAWLTKPYSKLQLEAVLSATLQKRP